MGLVYSMYGPCIQSIYHIIYVLFAANIKISVCKAKQITILGSRQHPPEKVSLWCDFFSAVKS